MNQSPNMDDLLKGVKLLMDQETEKEEPLRQYLKKHLGDKYSDSLDTIVVQGTGSQTTIGKYKIHFSPYVDGIQVFDSLKMMDFATRPTFMIIDDPLCPRENTKEDREKLSEWGVWYNNRYKEPKQ